MKILLTSAMALSVVVLFGANEPTQASSEYGQGQIIVIDHHGHHGHHGRHGYNNYGWGGYYGGPVYVDPPVYIDPYYGDPYYRSGAEIQLGPVGIDLF